MKLLAKNAEERYQTASGLEADLRRSLAEWDPMVASLHSRWAQTTRRRLLIPKSCTGGARDRHPARGLRPGRGPGAPELVLVSGYAGVGKSSVVNELHKALVPPRGFFAGSKFDQYKRDIPYATLAQAFQTLVGQILVKSQAEVEQCGTPSWKQWGRMGS